jgi:hypothetical protein
VLYSANVPRFAPPLFRCAEHTIDVSGSEHWLIGRKRAACPSCDWHRVLPAAK